MKFLFIVLLMVETEDCISIDISRTLLPFLISSLIISAFCSIIFLDFSFSDCIIVLNNSMKILVENEIKDIENVMENQLDLVKAVVKLKPLICLKG